MGHYKFALDWHLLVPEEVNGNWEEATEENDEAIELDAHANEWPSQENYQDAAEESSTAFCFVPLRYIWFGPGIMCKILFKSYLKEKSESSFQPNDTR